MLENRFTLANNGRVIIPANFRKELEVNEGESMIMRLIDGEIRIYSIKHALEKARNTVSKYVDDSTSLVDELYTLRRREVQAESEGLEDGK